jgi:hypothetical protein
MPYIPVT